MRPDRPMTREEVLEAVDRATEIAWQEERDREDREEVAAVTETSTQRSSRGGWCEESALPKGPNGRALCRRCAVEVPRGKRTFCSVSCVHEWKLRTNPGYLREQVFKRDKGVCCGCGVNTVEGKRWVRPSGRGTGHLWQADHIVPVVEGGGECGIDNLRTLCTACHKRETAALRKRLRERRQPVPPLFDESIINLPEEAE